MLDKQRLKSACAAAQCNQRFRVCMKTLCIISWAHVSEGTFSDVVAHVVSVLKNTVDSRYLELQGTIKHFRDIRTSTYQICGTEETINRTNTLNRMNM